MKRHTRTDALVHIKCHDVSPEGLNETGKQHDEATLFTNDGKHMAVYSDAAFVATGPLLHLDELINCVRQHPSWEY